MMMNIMRQKYNNFRKNKYPTYPFTPIASINRWILTENKPLVYKASNILSDKNKPMHSYFCQ